MTEEALILGVSRATLSTLLNGKADLSSDMALRIEKSSGPKMDTLMHMRAAYDIARTRKRCVGDKINRLHKGPKYLTKDKDSRN